MSNNNEYFLTAEGAAKYKEELVDLKGPQRTELARRLREAIQQGDLSENADYIKSKEDQSFLEGRIRELETLLGNSTIIEEMEELRPTLVGDRLASARGAGNARVGRGAVREIDREERSCERSIIPGHSIEGPIDPEVDIGDPQ